MMTTIPDVKRAVEKATEYFSTMMTVHDVRLEEVELSDDELLIRVTLSGIVPTPRDSPPNGDPEQVSAIGSLFKKNYERIYKVFTVESDGTVKSMKIREF